MELQSGAGGRPRLIRSGGFWRGRDEFGNLERELNETKYPSAAVRKLVRVGNDQAVSVLMTYLSTHLHDDSLYRDFGDYSYDLRSDITELIGKRLGIGPIARNGAGAFALSSEKWLAWWERSKGKAVTLSISGDFQDPYLKCLARKVEWGFPNAIYDLANTGGPHVVDILRILEDVGEPSFTLETIHDRAMLGLVKLGDEQALKAIAQKLDNGQSQWIGALQLIGGKEAVAILVNAFDSPTFLGEFRTRITPKDLAEYERGKDNFIVSTLATMIEYPPHFADPIEGQKKQWQEWWEKNKDTAQFVRPPITTYE